MGLVFGNNVPYKKTRRWIFRACLHKNTGQSLLFFGLIEGSYVMGDITCNATDDIGCRVFMICGDRLVKNIL